MWLKRWPVSLALLIFVGAGGALLAQAADHSDAPVQGPQVRQDANITDVHAFVVGPPTTPNLVLSLATNPAIPPTADSYVFPTDVTFEFNIDVDSAVNTASDPSGDGGIILDPHRINEDISFSIRFREDGSVRLQRKSRGAVMEDPQMVDFFAGLRDDPFIRTPRVGRNIAAIVLEVPLSSIVSQQSTLLIWATTKVEEFKGPQQENTGRALRSMFEEQTALNFLHPKHHTQKTGFAPEVIIYDTAKPAQFPNGRALTDDVVDLACTLAGECRVQANEGPEGPSENDVPFLATFPYLGEPHPPTM
jgi:hypothetical protein